MVFLKEETKLNLTWSEICWKKLKKIVFLEKLLATEVFNKYSFKKLKEIVLLKKWT